MTDVKHIDNVSFHDRDEMCRWLQQLSNEGRPAVFVLFELEYLIPPSVKRAFTQKKLKLNEGNTLLTRGE